MENVIIHNKTHGMLSSISITIYMWDAVYMQTQKASKVPRIGGIEDIMWHIAANSQDNKVHGANMGPTWVLSAPYGPHVGPTNLAIREGWGRPEYLITFANTCWTFLSMWFYQV